MYHDERLRELIQAVDVPPSSAGIGRAKATGRRRARRNRIAFSAAAVPAVTGAAYFAFAGPRFPALPHRF